MSSDAEMVMHEIRDALDDIVAFLDGKPGTDGVAALKQIAETVEILAAAVAQKASIDLSPVVSALASLRIECSPQITVQPAPVSVQSPAVNVHVPRPVSGWMFSVSYRPNGEIDQINATPKE